jgi:hypothetical protein
LYEAGVPHVVCWSTVVLDEPARLFSTGFYEALQNRQGCTYDQAFEAAKAVVLTCTHSGVVSGTVPARIQKYVFGDPLDPVVASAAKPGTVAGTPLLVAASVAAA